MSIQQTKKQSDLEKRLRLLRQQVYGREQNLEGRYEKKDKNVISEKSHSIFQYPASSIRGVNPISPSTSSVRDITYLRQDLFKILILASSALGIQIILFYLFKNNFLNFNFF